MARGRAVLLLIAAEDEAGAEDGGAVGSDGYQGDYIWKGCECGGHTRTWKVYRKGLCGRWSAWRGSGEV